MPLVFDLTPAFGNPDAPSSGSIMGWAASQNVFEVMTFVSFSFDELNGAWSGSGFNYGATVVMTAATENPLLQTMQSGSWFGNANTWGANGASLENHDKSQVVSDSAPNIGEGINTGEYNPFPIPAVPPEEPLKERDATRYGKSYSWRRDQPVRIRIFRR